jgi:hypothetical protein
MESHQREAGAEIKFEKARALNTETRAMQKRICREKQEIWIMKTDAETELEAARGFRQRAASLQKELNRTRANIRRLKKKPAPGKLVDAEPWPE